MTKTLNLYEKIQAVSMDVKNISKDMTVGKGQYSYKAVSDNAVILAVKKSEKKHRILSIPFSQELMSSEVIRIIDKNGVESLRYMENIKMTTRIIDLDDITKHLDIVSFAKGLDTSDKGFGKASTYARKYALLNAYKIATGEDPDSNASEKTTPVKTISDKKKKVYDYLNKNINTLQQVLKHFNVGELEDLNKLQVETIYYSYKQKGLIE